MASESPNCVVYQRVCLSDGLLRNPRARFSSVHGRCEAQSGGVPPDQVAMSQRASW